MLAHEIYLDANATTPVLPVAANAAFETMELSYGNPSSAHITGIRAKYIMETTRTAARHLLGARSGELIFTSGATEGIQTAIISSLWAAKQAGWVKPESKLLYGATEHKAVPESLKHWNEILDIHAEVLPIPVDNKGLLDLDFINEHGSDALMICTMAVNNETGVVQDLAELENAIRSVNPDVRWMVDCVQAMGKIDLGISDTSIDYAPFSGHKLYAPKGIGMLYIRHGAPYTPFIAGGGQESGLRSGTENLPGIAALGAIIKSINNEQDTTFKASDTLHQYRMMLANALTEAFHDVVFNNDFDISVPTTLNFAVKSLSAKEIMDLFDAANIRVSSGSACSSKVTGSFVLDAMGLPAWQSQGAIRMSFGPAATLKEIQDACLAIKSAAAALKTSCLITSDVEQDLEGQLDGLIQLHHNGACSWIVADKDSKQCIVIDPIEELADRIEKMARCRNYQVLAIIDTHSHADHASCAHMLRAVLGDLYSPFQHNQLGWPSENRMVMLANDEEVEALEVGRFQLTRLLTPGHTADSQTLLLSEKKGDLGNADIDYAFVGDMILIGGLGRTDFSISCADKFYHSLQRLGACINRETILCPSHDYSMQFTTTLNAELGGNELLRKTLQGAMDVHSFIGHKANIDNHIGQHQDASTIMCGALKSSDISEEGMNLSPELAKDYLLSHRDAVVLDVREAHEHELKQLDSHYHTQNVPLTRLTGFMADLLHSENKDKEVICICRSGSRSAVVVICFCFLIGFLRGQPINLDMRANGF